MIGELLRSHHGEEAWIFGKGPSIDAFDMREAGPLRICINESLLVVPSPKYFFAHDEVPIRRVADSWPEGCRAILQPERTAYALACGIPDSAIWAYSKSERDVDVLDWSAEQIAQTSCLLGLTGTVHSALHFCRLIGACAVVFVGMDGSGGYARSIGLSPPAGGGQHDRIRRDSIKVAERLGLEFHFVTREN
jgi:hypothetical protein